MRRVSQRLLFDTLFPPIPDTGARISADTTEDTRQISKNTERFRFIGPINRPAQTQGSAEFSRQATEAGDGQVLR